ncbi:MAG: hypothetical protein HKP61_13590 [Dactylosporangium sp.]|nr:hypothetical protein [Dactylosporangium sp.]NNJ61947.1 hypothetical protein [Dactylosporangium sp.]
MSTDTADHQPVETPTQHPAPRTRRSARLVDAAALAAFGLMGIYLLSGLFPDPAGLHVAGNRQDSVQNQWLLLHATRLFTHGENPLFTTLMNAPFGVNLMANTSILAFALPLAPVTLAFGPAVSSLVLLVLAPAGTSAAWYHVLSRHVVSSRFGAFVGAAFAGFAPAMVSHDTGHPNIVAQFLLPYIVLTVLRIRVPGRAVRTGLELAALVVLQVFINEEVLFLTAVTLGLFLLMVLAFRPQEVLPQVRSGLVTAGVTAVVAGAVLAYPLWHQFFGPMAYRGLPTFVLDYGADLASFPAFSTESLAGPPANIERIHANVTEENAFYGWPLLVLLVVMAVQLRRLVVARALLLTSAVLALLALGQTIFIGGRQTPLGGPWALVSHLPLFDSVVPTRLTLFVTPLIAILLAMSIDRAWPVDGWRGARLAAARLGRFGVSRPARVAWAGVVVAALVPIAPTPIDVAPNVPTPGFFTSGVWREHLPVGANVLPVPLGWEENVDVMRWQLAADLDFVTPGGYYLAPPPTGSDQRANFGPAYLPTLSQLLLASPDSVDAADISPQDAQQDLRTWWVDALVMPDSIEHAERVRTEVNRLIGPGRHIEDVWLWDVRT